MRGKTVDRLDFRARVMHVAVDPDLSRPILDAAAKRAFGLETDEQDAVLRISDVVPEVMENPSTFAHSRRRDDDRGTIQGIQALGILRLLDVLQHREIEDQIGIRQHLFPAVEDFGVHPIDRGRIHREGTVHVDPDVGNPAGLPELVQGVDDLLNAAQCERRNEDLATPGRGVADDFAKPVLGSRDRLVVLVSVRGFDDQGVDRPGGGSGSRMMGRPYRPMSPEKTIRVFPPSVSRRSTVALPRMWPASVYSNARFLRR